MSRFVLIDGHAMLHRAFHALPPLTKNGELVNAVYGFFSMFLKIVQDVSPVYVAVCFDRAAPTFRQQLYVGYQAQRPKMADDLGPQIELVHTILEKAGIAIFELDGYEADDLIGTLSVEAIKKENLEVVIVSGDRDLLQLVNGHVRVLAPIVGITNMILFDAQKVKEKYGLEPHQIVDYKALVGDASDNYPGVSGIGPKTASDLLKKYETFENLYQHLPDLPEKIATKLATDAEQANLAKKLATIATDAPIQFKLSACAFGEKQMGELKKSFEKLGFNSLLKRFFEEKDEKTLRQAQEKKTAEHIKQLGLL